MRKPTLILLFAAAASFGGLAAADADPSMHQVYEAASSGHLDQAQSMMAQVLKDHPASAKAHYVEAELDAKQGKYAAARDELQTAERLEPGLPFERPESAAALRAELYPQPQQRMVPRVEQAPRYVNAPDLRSSSGSHIPWGFLISIGLIGLIVWALLRRRQVVMSPYGYGGGGGPYGAGGAPYGGGYGGGGYPPGGGGSGLLGSLGTGLAVGAGVVAGEELAHHLLDGNGNRIVEGGQPVVYQDDPGSGNQNADMGGNDFGVNDSSSWDDGGSAGGGGDDSWS